jgi:hypothetical protein
MLNKNSIWLGVLIGIALPIVVFGLFQLVNYLLVSMFSESMAIPRDTLILLSFSSNLVPVRIYFVSLKFDKTGRGVLLVLFLMMILYFALIRP